MQLVVVAYSLIVYTGVPSPPTGNNMVITNTNSHGIISLKITNGNFTNLDVTSFVIKLETDNGVQYMWLVSVHYIAL